MSGAQAVGFRNKQVADLLFGNMDGHTTEAEQKALDDYVWYDWDNIVYAQADFTPVPSEITEGLTDYTFCNPYNNISDIPNPKAEGFLYGAPKTFFAFDFNTNQVSLVGRAKWSNDIEPMPWQGSPSFSTLYRSAVDFVKATKQLETMSTLDITRGETDHGFERILRSKEDRAIKAGELAVDDLVARNAFRESQVAVVLEEHPEFEPLIEQRVAKRALKNLAVRAERQYWESALQMGITTASKGRYSYLYPKSEAILYPVEDRLKQEDWERSHSARAQAASLQRDKEHDVIKNLFTREEISRLAELKFHRDYPPSERDTLFPRVPFEVESDMVMKLQSIVSREEVLTPPHEAPRITRDITEVPIADMIRYRDTIIHDLTQEYDIY